MTKVSLFQLGLKNLQTRHFLGPPAVGVGDGGDRAGLGCAQRLEKALTFGFKRFCVAFVIYNHHRLFH